MNKIWLLIPLLVIAGCQGPKEFRSDKSFVMRAMYMDNICGATGPHLKLQEETLLSATGEEIEYGFEFFTTDGVKTPDEPGSPYAKQGNMYELEGYYYYHIEYGRRILHPRFDLVGWRLVDADFERYWGLPKKEPMVFQLSRTYKTDCK